MMDLSARFEDLAWQQNVPIDVTLELTLRCNLRCQHCYNFDRQKYGAALPIISTASKNNQELSYQEWLRVIDELADAGAARLSFSGGEALLYPRVWDLLAHARSRHLFIGIKTNGALLSDATLKQMQEVGVGSVDVSLYGATAVTHDAFTVVEGSFEETLKGCRRLIKGNIPLRLSVCITQQNWTETAAMLSLGRDMGASVSVDMQVMARNKMALDIPNEASSDPMASRVNEEMMQELYRQGGPLHGLTSVRECSSNGSLLCRCARSGCAVSAVGEVYPCIAAPIPSGNIRHQSFAEIWKNSAVLNGIRALTDQDFKDCVSCSDRPFCQRSSGAMYRNTGDYTGAEKWSCQQAQVIRRTL